MNYLSCLPLVIVAFVVGTTCVTFYLAYVRYHHVTYLLPYISDTGTFSPESCIFGQALNIVAVLLGIAMHIKYLQVQEIYQKHHIEEKYEHNRITSYFGFISCCGISVVANFQETNLFWLHWVGAICAFGGGSVYLCLQTLIYIKISPVIGQRKTTMFRIVLSVVAMLSLVIFIIAAVLAYRLYKGNDVTKWTEADGGYDVHQISSTAEWICAGCTMVYVLLFQPEFKSITLRPLGVVLDEHKTTHGNNAA